MVAVQERADLLKILDGLVKRDGATSGLRGEVCVGVRGDSGYRWWRARLGPRFTSGFVERPSSSAHATLFIAESDADAILTKGRLPAEPELLFVDGDRDLLRRFIERYTSRTDWLGVRLGRN